MTKGFESLHVHVKIEIAGDHWNTAEDSQTLERKRFELVVQNEDETLDARSWQRQVALIGSKLSFRSSSLCSLCRGLALLIIFLWILFGCFGWCGLGCSLCLLVQCLARWIYDRIEL